jgi:hypothetical protein
MRAFPTERRENLMPIFLTNAEQEQCIVPAEAVDAL